MLSDGYHQYQHICTDVVSDTLTYAYYRQFAPDDSPYFSSCYHLVRIHFSNPSDIPTEDPDEDPDFLGGEYEDEFARIVAKLEQLQATLSSVQPISDQVEHDPNNWTLDDPTLTIDPSVEIPQKLDPPLPSWLNALPSWLALNNSALTALNPSSSVSCSFVIWNQPISIEFDCAPYQGFLSFLGNVIYFFGVLSALFIALEVV
jgi:hypothetical protein